MQDITFFNPLQCHEMYTFGSNLLLPNLKVFINFFLCWSSSHVLPQCSLCIEPLAVIAKTEICDTHGCPWSKGGLTSSFLHSIAIVGNISTSTF